MKNATLNSNEREPKYYPIEVLLKSQNQELPKDVNPAKKEVCGCGAECWGCSPHRLKHQAQVHTAGPRGASQVPIQGLLLLPKECILAARLPFACLLLV